MRNFFLLFRRELKALFLSPIAWVVLALIMSLHAFSFRTAITVLSKAASTNNIAVFVFNSPWFLLSFFFIFPLLTMRLFSEEKKSGTLETLMTAPVTSLQVVLAKYASVVVFYLILWIPTLVNFLFFRGVAGDRVELPTGSMTGAYAHLIFAGLFYLAVGIWASSLTQNQIIAAVTAFTVIIGHYVIITFALPIGVKIIGASSSPAFARLADYFQSLDYGGFVQGIVDTRALVYFASLALFFLFLTWHSLEYRRWKS